jgi:hypothetical protein
MSNVGSKKVIVKSILRGAPMVSHCRIRYSRVSFANILLGLILVTIGCNRNPGKVIVSGNVTYASEPVQLGQIRFVPIDVTEGPLTVAEILDGHYVAKSHGGVPIGGHRVEIRAFDMSGVIAAPGGPEPKQLIPEKYNDKSELTLTIDASSGRTLTKNFDLAP